MATEKKDFISTKRPWRHDALLNQLSLYLATPAFPKVLLSGANDLAQHHSGRIEWIYRVSGFNYYESRLIEWEGVGRVSVTIRRFVRSSYTQLTFCSMSPSPSTSPNSS